MKSTFVFLSILVAINLHAQEKKATVSSSKRFQLGISFSPDLCYRTLVNNDGSAGELVINSRNKNEQPKMGYTAGIIVGYTFKPGVALQTGLQLSNKGYRRKALDLVFEQPGMDNPTRAEFTYRYHYLEIPLLLNFSLGENKLHLVAGAGITTGFLLNASQRVSLEYADGRTVKNVQDASGTFKKVNISPTISLGLDYRLSALIHLRVEPTFRYGLIKMMDTPISERLWNTGLKISYLVSLH